MTNYVILVGRLTKEVEKVEKEGKITYYVNISIPRSYKNINGEYETDLIDIKLFNSSVYDYLHKGDLIGIRGQLENNEGKIEIVATKVTY